uniref:peptidylprolyl isomerase n=1 Tax=Steinernema glaseri TaxID=37863 RepID=A0A1I7ZKX6_9BILA
MEEASSTPPAEAARSVDSLSSSGRSNDGLRMIEHDDMVEVWNKRMAVSSGEPSLDGSALASDDERAAFSDSEVHKGVVATEENIAKQVKGPSSDALEVECEAEAHARADAALEAGDHDHEHHHEDVQVDQIESKPVEDGWEDVLGSGHLCRQIVTEGRTDKKPRKGQYVTVRIEDTLTHVDNYPELTFILGFGMVIDAWEMVVLLMNEGEKCKVRASSRFAYGAYGSREDPIIDANQDMEYTIELLSIGDSPTFTTMSFEEFAEFVEMLKTRGKHYFNREDYDKAVYVYKRSMDLRDIGDEDIPMKKLFSVVRSNIAMCYAKMGEYRTVKEEAEAALDLDPSNVKAMLKRAQALEKLNEFEDAVEQLKEACDLEPDSSHITRELNRVKGLLREQRAVERELYKRMMAGLDDPTVHRNRRMSFQMRYLMLSFFVVMFAMFFHFLFKMFREG